MRSNYITLAAIGLLIPLMAQAQNYTQKYLESNGRTYDSKNSSLESRGYQGQYGSYLYTPTAGSNSNGTQLGTNPYRAYRYAHETNLDSSGSYHLGNSGGTLSRGFSGVGRTGGSL